MLTFPLSYLLAFIYLALKNDTGDQNNAALALKWLASHTAACLRSAFIASSGLFCSAESQLHMAPHMLGKCFTNQLPHQTCQPLLKFLFPNVLCMTLRTCCGNIKACSPRGSLRSEESREHRERVERPLLYNLHITRLQSGSLESIQEKSIELIFQETNSCSLRRELGGDWGLEEMSM